MKNKKQNKQILKILSKVIKEEKHLDKEYLKSLSTKLKTQFPELIKKETILEQDVPINVSVDDTTDLLSMGDPVNCLIPQADNYNETATQDCAGTDLDALNPISTTNPDLDWSCCNFSGYDYDYDTFVYWTIDQNTGDCDVTGEIDDFYICPNQNYTNLQFGGTIAFNVIGETVDSDDGYCCNPNALPNPGMNTPLNFETWLNGECENEALVSLAVALNLGDGYGTSVGADAALINVLFDQDNGKDYYIDNECPSCLPQELPGAPYTLGEDWENGELNVVGGDNWPMSDYLITIESENDHLSFVPNDSCLISSCTQPFFDNYFCNDQSNFGPLCGGNMNSQFNGSAINAGYAVEVQLEPTTMCSYSGCINSYTDDTYVCTLWPSLCPGTNQAINYGEDNGFEFQLDGGLDNPTPNQGIAGGYDVSSWIDDSSTLNGVFSQDSDTGASPNACQVIPGCTNNSYTGINGFNPDANIDDGSCQWHGCADPDLAFLDQYVCNSTSLCDEGGNFPTQYNEGGNTGLFQSQNEDLPLIVNDAGYDIDGNSGEMIFTGGCPKIFGCTNSAFDNHNPDANLDNGSCFVVGCLDPTAPNFICNERPDICTSEDELIQTSYEGNVPVTGPGGVVQAVSELSGVPTPFGEYGSILVPCNECCGSYGCLDSEEGASQEWIDTYWNIDSPDNMYAGQTVQGIELPLEYPGPGYAPQNPCPDCTEESGDCNYDTNGNGIADWDDVPGCAPANGGYDEYGTSTVLNLNPDANLDNGSCIPVVYGCIDGGGMGQSWWEGNGTPYPGTVDGGTQNELTNFEGATPYSDLLGIDYPDIEAENYNPDANVDDGSCTYNVTISGCGDSSAPNYNPYVNDDQSYLTVGMQNYDWDTNICGYIYGCTDPNSITYVADAHVLPPATWVAFGTQNGQMVLPCAYDTPGCMEPTAANYDTEASVDDGSCYWEGCTQPGATNQSSFPSISSDSNYPSSLQSYLTSENTMFLNSGQELQTNGLGEFAGFDDGSCTFDNYCTDSEDLDEYICNDELYDALCDDNLQPNTDLGNWDGSGAEYCETQNPIIGCKDPNAMNYCTNCTEDRDNNSGGSYCRYTTCITPNGYPNQAINEGCLNTSCTVEYNSTNHPDVANGATYTYVAGNPNNMPAYYYNGILYGGLGWGEVGTSPDDYDNIANESVCQYEGCPDSTGVPEEYQSATPGEEISGQTSGFGGPLYYYNSANLGCEVEDVDSDDFESIVAGNTSCCYRVGCMDPQSGDYDPDATISATGGNAPEGTPQYNNGCTYTGGCTLSWAANWSGADTFLDDGSCYVWGCTNANADNYWCGDNMYTVIDGQPVYNEDLCDPTIPLEATPSVYEGVNFYVNDFGCYIGGCTDTNDLSFYDNLGFYNTDTPGNYYIDTDIPESMIPTQDDGSCDGTTFIDDNSIYGCTDPDAFNYNEFAFLDNNSCIPIIEGCTDSSACNYNPNANTDEDECFYCYLDNCDEYPNEGPNAIGCNGDLLFPNPGCQIPGACNYDSSYNLPCMETGVANGCCFWPQPNEDCFGNSTACPDNDNDGICNDDDEWWDDETNGEGCWDVWAYRCGDEEQQLFDFPCMRITDSNGYPLYHFNNYINPASKKDFLGPLIVSLSCQDISDAPAADQTWAAWSCWQGQNGEGGIQEQYPELAWICDCPPIPSIIDQIEDYQNPPYEHQCHWCPSVPNYNNSGYPAMGYWYLGSPSAEGTWGWQGSNSNFGDGDGQPGDDPDLGWNPDITLPDGIISAVNSDGDYSGAPATWPSCGSGNMMFMSPTFSSTWMSWAVEMENVCADLGYSGNPEIENSENIECQWCPFFTLGNLMPSNPNYETGGYWFPIPPEGQNANDWLESQGLPIPLGMAYDPTLIAEDNCQNYIIDGLIYDSENNLNPNGTNSSTYTVENHTNVWNAYCMSIDPDYSNPGWPENTGEFLNNQNDWWWDDEDITFQFGNFSGNTAMFAEHCPGDQNFEFPGFTIQVSDQVDPMDGCQVGMPSAMADVDCQDYIEGTLLSGAPGSTLNSLSNSGWYSVPQEYNDQISYVEVPDGATATIFADYLHGAGLANQSQTIVGPAAICLTELGWDANDAISSIVINWDQIPPNDSSIDLSNLTSLGLPAGGEGFTYDGEGLIDYDTMIENNLGCPDATIRYTDPSTDTLTEVSWESACGAWVGDQDLNDLALNSVSCAYEYTLCNTGTGEVLPGTLSGNYNNGYENMTLDYSAEKIQQLCTDEAIGQLKKTGPANGGSCLTCEPMFQDFGLCSSFTGIEEDCSLFEIPFIYEIYNNTLAVSNIFYSYQWMKNGQTLEGETNSTLYYEEEGAYQVQVYGGGSGTLPGSCSATSVAINVGETDYIDSDNDGIDDYANMPEAACGGNSATGWLYPDLCGICNGNNDQCNGCTDPNAENYNANAILDCQFDSIHLNQIDPLHLIPESEGGLNPNQWQDIEYPMWTQPFFSHINNQISNDIVSGNTCCEYGPESQGIDPVDDETGFEGTGESEYYDYCWGECYTPGNVGPVPNCIATYVQEMPGQNFGVEEVADLCVDDCISIMNAGGNFTTENNCPYVGPVGMPTDTSDDEDDNNTPTGTPEQPAQDTALDSEPQ